MKSCPSAVLGLAESLRQMQKADKGFIGDTANNSPPIPTVIGGTNPPPSTGNQPNRNTPAGKATEGFLGGPKTADTLKAVEVDKASSEERKYQNPSDPNETVAVKITRSGQEGTKHFYSGVVQVAIGITQVSLAQQEKAENGTSDENQNVLNAGLQNIGEGTAKVETAREIVNHANGIAQHENKRASVGSSGADPLSPSPSFEREKASSDANEKLQEMEDVAGVPAASLIAAVNSGGGHNEVLSIAGGAKGVHLSESEVASIPQFSFSTASTESRSNPSTPTETGNVSFTGAMKGLNRSLSTGKTALAPAAERKPTSITSAPRSVTDEPRLARQPTTFSVPSAAS